MRRAAAPIVLATAAALAAATLPAQAASPIDPDQADSYGSVRNILPPGQRGTIPHDHIDPSAPLRLVAGGLHHHAPHVRTELRAAQRDRLAKRARRLGGGEQDRGAAEKAGAKEGGGHCRGG